MHQRPIEWLEPRCFYSAGSLDASFGLGGKVVTTISQRDDAITALAVQADGKIVAAGHSNGVAIVRYRPDGSIDTSFGDGGKATFGGFAGVRRVVIQPDRKLLLAGVADGFGIARLNTDGSVDGDFGIAGVATNGFFGRGAGAESIAIQADGKIVVAGDVSLSSSGRVTIGVARFNTDGSIDTSFGTSGRSLIDLGDSTVVVTRELLFQPDGRIIIGGFGGSPFSNFVLVRLNVNGTLDSGFGTGGKVTFNAAPQGGEGRLYDLGLQRSGKIVIAGGPFIMRLNTDGTLDAAFGSSGTTASGIAFADSNVYLSLDSEDRISIAGHVRGVAGTLDFAVARFQADGAVDRDFGTLGRTTTDFDFSDDAVYAITADADGNILLGGSTSANGNDFALARFDGGSGQGPRAEVVARHVFYNHSSFDGNDVAANAADDAAIATDKNALLAGQDRLPGFDNVTSFSKGINGVMIDVAGLPQDQPLGAADLDFRSGPGLSALSSGPSVVQVSVRRGAGAGGSDRVTVTWPDYIPGVLSLVPQAVANGWLQVTMKANDHTGLAAPDVFFYGNLIGEAGDGGGAAGWRVSALDVAAVKRALNTPTTVATPTDFNRDGRVNALDVALVKRNLARSLSATPAAPAIPQPAAPDPEESDGFVAQLLG